MKNEHDIEKMLREGRGLSLSPMEKQSIKTVLLHHASASLFERRAVPSPWSIFFVRGATAFAAVLLVFTGVGFASQQSMPGDTLYAVKVHVMEEAILLSKFDPEERAVYETSLMENRLEELKEMAERDEILSAEDIALMAEQINEHVTDATETLSEEGDFQHEERIEAFSKLNGYAKAQTKIVAKEKAFEAIVESLDKTEDQTTDSLAMVVEDFSQEQPEAFTEYLSDQLNEVTADLTASSTDEALRDAAEQELHNVHESLIEGDAIDALMSIIKVQQAIDAETHGEEETVISDE